MLYLEFKIYKQLVKYAYKIIIGEVFLLHIHFKAILVFSLSCEMKPNVRTLKYFTMLIFLHDTSNCLMKVCGIAPTGCFNSSDPNVPQVAFV